MPVMRLLALAIVVMGLAACGDGDDGPHTRLVDFTADERAMFCQTHELKALGCHPAGGGCQAFATTNTCDELFDALPATCEATAAELEACIDEPVDLQVCQVNPGCGSLCGVALWSGPHTCA